MNSEKKNLIIGLLIFSVVFVFAAAVQYIRLSEFEMTDMGLWAEEARFVETGDNRQFDLLGPYGHPGGPLILGTIAVRKTALGLFDTALSYKTSLLFFVTVVNGLVIAGIALLCFFIRSTYPWWLVVALMLSLNRLYEHATPPSLLAALLSVLLFLYTLWVFENKPGKIAYFFAWGAIAGVLLGVRIDVGLAVTGAFVFLLAKSSAKKLLAVAVSAALFFVLSNPFMHVMPMKHLYDLGRKMLLHAGALATSHISFVDFVSLAGLMIVSIVLSCAILFLGEDKKQGMLHLKAVTVLYAFTLIFCTILFNAGYQSPRYFLPMIFIWESLLPLFLLTLMNSLRFDFLTTPRAFKWARRLVFAVTLVIVAGFPAFTLLNNYLLLKV